VSCTGTSGLIGDGGSPPAPTSPLVAAGSNDCVGAGLIDEWPQARHAVSIEIFLQDTLVGRSSRLLRLKASQTASSGGIEHSDACVHRSSFVDAAMIVIKPSMQRMCMAARLVS
jgi:hypothetical protein